MYPTVLVIVPSYNEGSRIQDVLLGLREAGFENILTINDGSEDDTEHKALSTGAVVISHLVNLGVGAGSRTGFDYALSHGYEYALTFDGDGQMKAQDAVRICEEALKGNDFVYGSRNFDLTGVPKIRKYINTLADLLTSFLTGRFIPDTQSGLRCIKLDLLKDLQLRSRGHSISSELIIESIRNGVLPKPVLITAIYTRESLQKGQKISNSFRVAKELLGY